MARWRSSQSGILDDLIVFGIVAAAAYYLWTNKETRSAIERIFTPIGESLGIPTNPSNNTAPIPHPEAGGSAQQDSDRVSGSVAPVIARNVSPDQACELDIINMMKEMSVCQYVITYAKCPYNGKTYRFGSSCIPKGWQKV